MKTIFLNIDNVFSSNKTRVASGKSPLNLDENNRDAFDWTSIGLIRRICTGRQIQIVAYSHLANNYSRQFFNEYFDLPITALINPQNSITTSSGFSLDIVENFTAMVTKWTIENAFLDEFLLIDTPQKTGLDIYHSCVFIDPNEGLTLLDYGQCCDTLNVAH